MSLRVPHEALGLFDLGLGLLGAPGHSLRNSGWWGHSRTAGRGGGDGTRHSATLETSGCLWGDGTNTQDPQEKNEGPSG